MTFLNFSQRVRAPLYAVLLAFTPVLTSVQMGCGNILACENDYDCAGERVCRKVEDTETGEKIFQCIDPLLEPSLSSESEVDSVCGNSLLTGKYLISTSCKGGTPIAFSGSSCRGYWKDTRNEFSIDYLGMTLLGKEILSRSRSPNTAVINLHRALLREDFGTFEEAFPDYADDNNSESGTPAEIRDRVERLWEIDIERMQCYLAEDEQLYFAEVNGRIETNPDLLLFLASYPWVNENSCHAQRDDFWKEGCDEEHPYSID